MSGHLIVEGIFEGDRILQLIYIEKSPFRIHFLNTLKYAPAIKEIYYAWKNVKPMLMIQVAEEFQVFIQQTYCGALDNQFLNPLNLD